MKNRETTEEEKALPAEGNLVENFVEISIQGKEGQTWTL